MTTKNPAIKTKSPFSFSKFLGNWGSIIALVLVFTIFAVKMSYNFV